MIDEMMNIMTNTLSNNFNFISPFFIALMHLINAYNMLTDDTQHVVIQVIDSTESMIEQVIGNVSNLIFVYVRRGVKRLTGVALIYTFQNQ